MNALRVFVFCMCVETAFNGTDKQNYFIADYFVYQDDISHEKEMSKILYVIIIVSTLMSVMHKTL